MSENTQGSGWWQASDRNWYPAHLHPAWTEPPAIDDNRFVAPAPGPSRPLRRWKTAAMAVASLLLIAAGVVVIDHAVSRSDIAGIRRINLAGETPPQILQRSLAAARKSTSFQLVVSEHVSGESSDVDIYVGPHGSTLSESAGGADMKLEVIDDQVYLLANGPFWSSFLSLAASNSQFDGDWIEMPQSDSEISQLTEYVNARDLVSNLLELTAPITRVVSRAARGTVLLQGRLPNSTFNEGSGGGLLATIAVSEAAPFYPMSVSYGDADPQTGSATYSFSHWGKEMALAPVSGAVPLAKLEATLKSSAPAVNPVSPGPIPPGTVPPGSVRAVVAHPATPGVSVDPAEADSVARMLWKYRELAAHYRDPQALALIESGPALAVDRPVCLSGCLAPALSVMSALAVVINQHTTWPVSFLATASYSGHCSLSPCDDTFVAVQQRAGAPWTIALVVSYSGMPPEPDPSQTYMGYSDVPVLSVNPALYLTQYAAYLQSAKDTGKAPKSTWLQPDYFTSGLLSTNYTPPATDRAKGFTNYFDYSAGDSPVYVFAVATDQGFVCGTVDWTDVSTALPGLELVQPPDRSSWEATLAPGHYKRIVDHGIHMDCFNFSLSSPKSAFVDGDWHGSTAASGT